MQPIKHDGRLGSLARAHVDDLHGSVDDPATTRDADAVDNELPEQGGQGVVMVQAALILDVSMYTVPDAALDPMTTEIGLAVHDTRDPHGRPAFEVLLLASR